MYKCLNWLSFFAVLLLLGCSGGLDKAQAETAQGKADIVSDFCVEYGHSPDCDLCAEYGWYGDGACDEFCTHTDGDCLDCDIVDDGLADCVYEGGIGMLQQCAELMDLGDVRGCCLSGGISAGHCDAIDFDAEGAETAPCERIAAEITDCGHATASGHFETCIHDASAAELEQMQACCATTDEHVFCDYFLTEPQCDIVDDSIADCVYDGGRIGDCAAVESSVAISGCCVNYDYSFCPYAITPEDSTGGTCGEMDTAVVECGRTYGDSQLGACVRAEGEDAHRRMQTCCESSDALSFCDYFLDEGQCDIVDDAIADCVFDGGTMEDCIEIGGSIAATGCCARYGYTFCDSIR